MGSATPLSEEEQEFERKTDAYAELINYFIDHPEAPLDPTLRLYINRIKRELEETPEEAPAAAGFQRRLVH